MEKKEAINKIKQISNKIVNSFWFVLIIGIIILLKTIFFYNNTITANEEIEGNLIVGTIFFVTILMCFICVLPNRARVITAIIVNLLISILLCSDELYYSYSNNVLSLAQVTNIQYGEEIVNTLPSLFKLKDILYFLDIIILVVLIVLKKIEIVKKKKKTKLQILGKVLIGILGVAIFIYTGNNYVEKGKDKSYNKDLQIKDATIFGYHIYDIKSTFNIKNNAKYNNYDDMIKDYEELKNDYDTRYNQIESYYDGILEGKNIIILQLESIQEFVVNKKINGREITPNLNKFLRENIEFSNMHMQSYSSTADSEHSTITSIYPMENGMSFSKYFANAYDDLFKMFNSADYNTSYMHGNYPYFWNRGNVYGRLNLNELNLKEEFEDTSEEISGYLSDELLYRQAVQKLKTYRNPFISYIVAASSHTPFNLEGLQDRSKISIDIGEFRDTFFGNYLEAANYADYAFGVFIDELKKEGLYDDTAILVFGDHNGVNMYDDKLIEFLKKTNPNLTDVDLKLNYTRVLCGFKIPGLKNLKIEKPVNKLDIKPTLTYLAGIKDGFSLGTNMFGKKDFICLNNERIISSRYYYDEKWYDIYTGEEVDMKKIDENTKEMLDRHYYDMKMELDISNSVSINNLLKDEV